MRQSLIIGAGISGATAGRILAEHGFQVTIIEKRDHIGGNIYDYYEEGVLIHKYGPHLFHTKLEHVASFVKKFSDFFPYEHRVLGEIEETLVPVPFNFKSIDLLFSKEKAAHLKEVLKNAYQEGQDVPIMELRKHHDPEVRKLAEYVFRNVFYGYTKKQWGKAPEEMDPSVMARVPVRMSYDDRYFTDEFQMMPSDGYTEMVKRMLGHPGICIRLGCDIFDYMQLKDGKIFFNGEVFSGPVVYTGCIEDLLGHKYGRLPYRSLHFSLEKHNIAQFQPAVQINYPNRYSYTRISEFKLVQRKPVPDKTVVSYEYPKPCGEGDIPCYPMASKESGELYQRYRTQLQAFQNLHLLGRLAEYRYYNMDLTIDRAMKMAAGLLEIY